MGPHLSPLGPLPSFAGARILAQMVYYVHAYLRVVPAGSPAPLRPYEPAVRTSHSVPLPCKWLAHS